MALPDNYKPNATQSRYLKFKEPGQYKFRILSDALEGYEGWANKKPIRAKTLNDLPNENWDTEPKHFLVMVVWDRAAAEKKRQLITADKADEAKEINPIKILEITQGSIKRAIFDYEKNEDWGDAKEYDLTVTKTGEGMESRYSTIASPHKALTPDIIGALKLEKINLEALFEGGNPFGDKKGDENIDPNDLPF